MYLTNHHVLSSTNLDDLRETFAKVFTPHEFNISKKNTEIDASVYACTVGELGLAHFSYGQNVPIKTQLHDDQCQNSIILNIPIAGKGQFEQNGKIMDVSLNKGLVFDFKQPFTATTIGYEALTLSFSLDTLKQFARTQMGNCVDAINFKFDKTINMNTLAGHSLRHAIINVAEEMNNSLSVATNDIAIENLQNNLLSQFMALQPNSFMSFEKNTISPSFMHRHVKRARDYIYAHAHEKITLKNLVDYAGCSYRSMQNAFNEAFGLSPMAYLTIIRLKSFRKELLDEKNTELSISIIAKRWGFVHMGRLSCLYKNQFGVLPSAEFQQTKIKNTS